MTISELCVKRPVFAVMLIGFLLVLGIFSFRELGVDLFPKADPAVVNVSVKLPGATAEEVVTQILMPLEEAVSSVSGLDELNSSASEGSGSLTLNFTLERDIEGAAQDIREKVSSAMRKLPSGIDPPIITKADPDADPVLSMVVAGGGSLRQTTEIADTVIKPALETVDGVAAVNLSGGRPRQIRVFADADKLEAYNITISRLENAIQSQNIEVPGGTINRGDVQLGVRTMGRIESPDQFNDIVVANVKGSPIRLRDVGRVEDTYPEATSWNLLRGKEAVVLSVQRQSGSNTLQVIEAAKAKLQQIQRTLPPSTKIEIINDNSTFIKASVASLEEHLLLGSLLASLVVMLFIGNLRCVLIAALAIPTSVIATFTLLKAMNFTLNSMTLLGLTLAVGIVIDDAIVVLENIVRYIEEKGYEPRQAAIDATQEITLAVVATTLSLVIIFVPIAFTTGYARVYLNSFGWTMAFAVMVSMLVSLTLTPMLCSRMLKPKSAPSGDAAAAGGAHSHDSKDNRWFRWMDRNYGRTLEWSLNHRALTVLLAAATFALTVPLNKWVGREFVPPDDQSELRINFSPPVDTSIAGTEKIAAELTSKIERVRGVEFTWASVSKNSSIYVRLIDASQRKYSNLDVANDIRRQVLLLPQYAALRSKILMPSVLGSGDNLAPVRALIAGPDVYRVADITVRAMNELKTVPGLVDISSNINLNRPELQINIDRQRASDLGVQVGDVARAVRLMIAGTDQISTYKEGDQQYDVMMQLLPEQQKNPDVLARLMIPSATVGQVRLDNIATIQRGVGPLQLDRYNRQFRVVLGSGYDASVVSYDTAARLVREAANKALLPGYSVRLVGTAKVLDETTQSLILAFLLATIFMYMVLAAQFESFLHPFTIMLALPLSIPFALLTLWLTHRTLNLWSALGIFLLLGVVKKNGILQVDYTNKLREAGMPLREAIVKANHVRLRPILMTTFSIVAGLIPTATGIGAGAAQRSAIAVTIIGGQSLCLLLTLLVTPVAYSLFSELAERRFFQVLHARMASLRLSVSRVFNL
jgi:hydrophobic/amphiphilic exporter-1 (mainly G- bacteria), HAE1 family